MLRSIYLSPAFSCASEIDSIRRAYDPLASKICPHITLVFPFESSLGDEELAAHAMEAISSVGGFRITLGRPQVSGDYIWLPVMQGRDKVGALHDALYRGTLSLHLDSKRSYDPHVTIARVGGRALDRAYESALALQGPFEAFVDQFFIERIMPDESSSVECVIELKKEKAELSPQAPSQGPV
jgi:2'-5' RNA ligase